jgi:hypothetical protein
MSNLGMYRASQLAASLDETCEEMVANQHFGPEMHERVMNQFDKVGG